MATVLDKPTLNEKLTLIRAERYACQSVARRILPKERVSKCLRQLVNKSEVEVWKHRKTEKAFYNGLVVCGSVWTCPVCAAKISERRRLELKQAFDKQKDNGGYVALLTLTIRHKKTDRLKDTLKKFSDALNKFRSGKRYQKLRERMNMIGSIRDFEITYSEKNGFHPHIHLALFYLNAVDLREIEKEMYELYSKACEKFGLSTLRGIGLDLQSGDQANDYLAKYGTWSLEQEMSKSHIKKGKMGSYTPFDFLRATLHDDDDKWLKLFKEYAEALKGKTQLFWSPGLKKHFAIGEKSDEQLAQEKQEEADLLGAIKYDTWKFIIKYDYRAELLGWIEQYGFDIALHKIIKKESSWHEDSQT